jgi:hypothetical protein
MGSPSPLQPYRRLTGGCLLQPLNGTTPSMQTAVMQTLAEQMKRGGANADGGNLASLTQQIADQLRVAVSKGLININILNQPLPQQTLVLLNQLLQRVPKLEQANVELTSLRQRTGGTMNAAQQTEYDRLVHEIASLQQEINSLQTKINDNAGLSAPNGSVSSGAGQNGARLGGDGQQSGSAATTPIDGGSKLLVRFLFRHTFILIKDTPYSKKFRCQYRCQTMTKLFIYI